MIFYNLERELKKKHLINLWVTFHKNLFNLIIWIISHQLHLNIFDTIIHNNKLYYQ